MTESDAVTVRGLRKTYGSRAAPAGTGGLRAAADLVAQLRQAQAGLAARARAEERNRIGRELHDVIAHTLTVSLLHITSERAESLGGSCEAGPGGQGWLVAARLPLAAGGRQKGAM
jgi:hypothetical protein